MFKALKLQEWAIFLFQMSFFTECAPFLLEFEFFLTLMIKKAKGLELMKIIFMTDLNTFGSKILLILKIMDFENVPLTKVVHVYVIEDMNAFVVKMYLYLKCSVKGGTQNTNFKVINQHKNDMCHV
jgi:hypothetical protein